MFSQSSLCNYRGISFLDMLELLLSPFHDLVWKPWAPGRCKFFMYLLLQNRIWTADRLMQQDGRITISVHFMRAIWKHGKTCSLSALIHASFGTGLEVGCNVLSVWIGRREISPSSMKVDSPVLRVFRMSACSGLC